MSIDVQAGVGAHAVLTTPGDTKFYRSDARLARQSVAIECAGIVEWLPQETIFFDACHAHLSSRVQLRPGGVYIGWDVACWGRPASGERFAHGDVYFSNHIDLGDRPLWREYGRVGGGSRVLQSDAGMGNAPVSGTLLAAGVAISSGLWARIVPSSPVQ